MDNKTRRRNRDSGKNMAIYIVLIALAIALTVGIVFLCNANKVFMKTPDQKQVGTSGDEIKTTQSGIEIETKIDNALTTIDVAAPDARKEGFYNFLVVGRDKAGLNTDVIMVVSFDTKNNKAAIVQIPRDTYIEASPNVGNKKINAIFATGYSEVRRKGGNAKECVEGGMSTLSDAILSAFGIVIDKYVQVNTDGFRQIVDAIGGVEVEIQENMFYNDPEQNLYIDLKKGKHLLDGAKAEGFVRFRYGYVNADIGRMDAQKIFMTAFMKKMLSTSTVAKIPDLISIVNANTVTDVSTSDMTFFGTEALDLKLDSVSMFTMQGAPAWHKNVSYVSMYPKSNLELVNNHFNVFTKPLTIEDVNVRLLVNEPDGYTVEELTAEDISQESVKIDFLRGSGNSAPVQGTPAKVTETTTPEVSENDAEASDDEASTAVEEAESESVDDEADTPAEEAPAPSEETEAPSADVTEE